MPSYNPVLKGVFVQLIGCTRNWWGVKEVTVLTVSTKPFPLVAVEMRLVVRTGGKASSPRMLNPNAPGGRMRYSPDGTLTVVVVNEKFAFVTGAEDGGYGWPYPPVFGVSEVVNVVTTVLEK